MTARVAPSLTGVAIRVAPVASKAIVYGLMSLGAYSFLSDPREFVASAASFPGGLAGILDEYVTVALRSARAFKASTGFLRTYRAITGKPVSLTDQVTGGPWNVHVGPAYPVGAAPEAGHTASVRYLDTDGSVLAEWVEVSGQQTADQLALGWPAGSLSSHTEPKALTRVFLKEGQTLEMNGIKAPCNSCKGVMSGGSSGGATVSYSSQSGELSVYEQGEKVN